MPELLPVYNYRIDFPLTGETERKHLQLMERIDELKKDLAKKDFKGKKGLKNLVCFAPYTNAATCVFSTIGEEDTLPQAIKELKLEKPDNWIAKLFLTKAFAPSFKPSAKKLEEEQLWYNSIKRETSVKKFYEKYVKGESTEMTRAAARKQEQLTLNGETGHVMATD